MTIFFNTIFFIWRTASCFSEVFSFIRSSYNENPYIDLLTFKFLSTLKYKNPLTLKNFPHEGINTHIEFTSYLYLCVFERITFEEQVSYIENGVGAGFLKSKTFGYNGGIHKVSIGKMALPGR